MAITNEQVIRYSNETIRPIAEKMRNLKSEVDAALVTWYAQISSNCTNDVGEVLEDGRVVDGVSVINGEDITNFVNQMKAYQTQLNLGGVADVISKPCVRPLTVG